MKGGDKNGVKVVPKHEAGKVLKAKYLEDLENSVRGRTPVAGTGIDIIYTDGGANITVCMLGLDLGEQVGLTVCSNGVPTVITVFALTQGG